MTLNKEDRSRAKIRLLAGRVRATQLAPYFSSALFALVPVERLNFGTFAVDNRWRMYFDPQCCLDWTVDEIAAVWLHEVGHVVRSHGKRYEAMGDGVKNGYLWNASADASINSDLRDAQILLPDPDKRYYAEPNSQFPDWKRGMTTEELYRRARSHADPPPPQPEGGDTAGDSDSSDSSPEPPPEGSEPSEQESAPGSSEDASEDPEGAEEGASAPSEGETSESDDTESSGEGSTQEKSTGDSSDDESTEGDADSSSGEGQPGIGDQEEPGKPHDCGSGATGGPPRDYEEKDNDDGSVDDGKAEQIRQQVAEDIIAHNDAYGNVPGGWVREAEDILDPKVDWRKEINSVVRRVSIMIAGKKDYTYSKPSRRSSGSAFFFPSLRQPRPPEIAIVLDTSGSMTSKDLAECLAEISDIIRRTSRATSEGLVRVINCDAGATEVQKVKEISNFEIVGGGGTDMRVGIKAASKLVPTPDLIITMTDGGTPWPRKIPPAAPRAKYVALLVGKQAQTNFRKPDSMKIPEWMHTIIVD